MGCGGGVSGITDWWSRDYLPVRTGIAWRDLPREFGPWQTVWKRHRRLAGDGTWERVLTALLSRACAAGQIDWGVAVDSTRPGAIQWWNCSTCSSNDSAILLTWDFESELMPRVFTSWGPGCDVREACIRGVVRRVETPAR